MDIKKSIGDGFKLANQNLKAVACLFGIYFFIGIIRTITIGNKTPDLFGTVDWVLMILLSIISIIIGTFLQGGLIGNIKNILGGGTIEKALVVENGKKFFFRILLFTLLVIGLYFGLSLLFMGLVALFGLLPGFLSILLVILCGFLFIFALVAIGLSFAFTQFLIVLDDDKVISSIKKSINFVKSNIWNALGFLVVIMLVFLLAVSLPVWLVSLLINFLFLKAGSGLLISQIISGIPINLATSYLLIVGITSFHTFYKTTKGISGAGAQPVQETPPSAPTA